MKNINTMWACLQDCHRKRDNSPSKKSKAVAKRAKNIINVKTSKARLQQD